MEERVWDLASAPPVVALPVLDLPDLPDIVDLVVVVVGWLSGEWLAVVVMGGKWGDDKRGQAVFIWTPCGCALLCLLMNALAIGST